MASGFYFKKFISSYLITLLIPLLLIGSYSFYLTKDYVLDRYTRTNESYNGHLKQAMEIQYKKLEDIHVRLVHDPLTRKFDLMESPITALRLQGKLGDFTFTNDILSDMLIYFDQDKYVYTCYTSCDVNKMDSLLTPFISIAENYYEHTIDSNEDFEAFISHTSHLERLNNKITFMSFPMENSEGIITMIIDTTKLEALFNSFDTYEHPIKYLVYDDLNGIQATNLEDLTLRDLNQLLAGTDQTTITFRERNYLLSASKSSRSNFTYVSLIDQQDINGSIMSSQQPFWYGILFCLILSSMSIYYWMHKLYQPILNLNQLSNKVSPSPIMSGPMNELDHVEKTISYLASTNKELNQRIRNYTHSSKNHFLYQIIKGFYATKENLLAQAEKEGFHFDFSYFSIAVVTFKENNYFVTHKDKFLSLMKEQMVNLEANFYHYDHFESNKIILLFCCEQKTLTDIRALFSMLQPRLYDECSISTTIGLGEPSTLPSEIVKSYVQASSALQYEFINGVNKTYAYSEKGLDNYTKELSPIKRLERLKNLILLHDEEGIHHLVTNLELYLKQASLPLFTLRGMCHEINHMMIDLINNLQQFYPSINMEEATRFLLTDHSTMHAFFIALEKVSLLLSQTVAENADEEHVTFVSQMKKYIDAHAMDAMFSLNTMSDHFHRSPSQLCQVFKDDTNMTITDYLTDLRIKKAKVMLSSTSESVKAIAQAVGYNNVSSFIRRFKQINSMTPGQFRDHYGSDVS